MDTFLTIDNLLAVVKILHKYYPNYLIYVGVDKFDLHILKFLHNYDYCDFEVIVANNFDCKLNKKSYYKINIGKFTRLFRRAMSAVCGQEYVDALKNYENYEKPIDKKLLNL